MFLRDFSFRFDPASNEQQNIPLDLSKAKKRKLDTPHPDLPSIAGDSMQKFHLKNEKNIE
jgi:hypothetical protein